MRRPKMIEKYIAPRYAELGYEYTCEIPVEFIFYNPDKKVTVFYTLSKDRKQLRMQFLLEYGKRLINVLNAKELVEAHEPVPDTRWSWDNDQFLEAAERHTDCAINIVLPILERTSQSVVPFTDELYQLLSDHPEEQARAFAEQNHRDLNYSVENTDWINSWFFAQLPEDPLQRNQVFQENREMFIGFVAYIGELTRKKLPFNSQWQWVTNPFQADDREFGVLYEKECENGRIGDNPLNKFIYRWNFYDVLKRVPNLI